MLPISSSPRILRHACVAAALLTALEGCAGGPGRPRPATVPRERTAEVGWALPAASFPTQRLFRLHYDSAEKGDGALRLVLRLESPDRYRLTVADRLGRPLYTIDAGTDGALLADHRERLVCPLDSEARLEELPLDPLPLASLPAVLLGRVPALPAGEPELADGATLDRQSLTFRDRAGRRWTADLVRGTPVAWTLWADGEPSVWWIRSGNESLLSDRDRGLQMSWRETGREPLAEPLGPPLAPAGYLPGVCGPEDPDGI